MALSGVCRVKSHGVCLLCCRCQGHPGAKDKSPETPRILRYQDTMGRRQSFPFHKESWVCKLGKITVIEFRQYQVVGCPWCLGVLGAWVSLVSLVPCPWCLGVLGVWVSLVPGCLVTGCPWRLGVLGAWVSLVSLVPLVSLAPLCSCVAQV